MAASLFPLSIPPTFAFLPPRARSAPSFSPSPQPPATHGGAAGPDPAPAPAPLPAPHPLRSRSIPAPLPIGSHSAPGAFPLCSRSLPTPLPLRSAQPPPRSVGDSPAPPAGRPREGRPRAAPAPRRPRCGHPRGPEGERGRGAPGPLRSRAGMRMTDRHRCSHVPCPRELRSPTQPGARGTLEGTGQDPSPVPAGFLLGDRGYTRHWSYAPPCAELGSNVKNWFKARVILSQPFLGCPFPSGG